MSISWSSACFFYEVHILWLTTMPLSPNKNRHDWRVFRKTPYISTVSDNCWCPMIASWPVKLYIYLYTYDPESSYSKKIQIYNKTKYTFMIKSMNFSEHVALAIPSCKSLIKAHSVLVWSDILSIFTTITLTVRITWGPSSTLFSLLSRRIVIKQFTRSFSVSFDGLFAKVRFWNNWKAK